MRYRIAVRGKDVELRGYIDSDKRDELTTLANVFRDGPLKAMVVASPADTDYNPFGEQLEGGSLGGF